jgi:putative glutamine amidotransferase
MQRWCAIRPLIGIPTFHDTSLPEKLPERFGMSRPYITALDAAGAAPVLLPLALGADALRAIFDRLDGVFFAGGGDVNPACYSQVPHEKTEGIDRLRDDTEQLLAKWALETRKPVLGVCRGVQTLNVAAGGTLIQDVNIQVPQAIRHQYFPDKPRDFVAHEISTITGTSLSTILGLQARVNSFHHQAVDRVANGFTVSAIAPDGVVEAIEGSDTSRFLIGVQWHPESLITFDDSMLNLFKTFVNAA